MRHRNLAEIAVCALFLCSAPAGAVVVDGQLDPEYGAAIVTQAIQTGLGAGQITGDNSLGDLDYANGSELDAAHGYIANGVLHLFLAGNVAMRLNQNQNQTVGHLLDVFLDTAPGGQNVLNGLGAGDPLNGFAFDPGFEADHLLELVGDGGGNQIPPSWSVWYQALSAGSGGVRQFVGVGQAGGPGTLAGGTNPQGILATIDNRNTAGVTFGCNASSGAGVTTGTEWAIPLAAIGNPGGCVRVTAILRVRESSTSPVSNQFLGSAPAGTCPPGQASNVNLATIGGDQFFSVCPSAAGVGPDAARGVALALGGPNPGRGDRVRVTFTLPDARPATLRLVDCAGRVVREQAVSAGTNGHGTAELAQGRALSPGLYWVRLSTEAAGVARSVCVIR